VKGVFEHPFRFGRRFVVNYAASLFFWGGARSEKDFGANRLRLARRLSFEEAIVRLKQKKFRGSRDAICLPTAGKIFANGTAIEPLRACTNPDRLSLVFWDGSKCKTGSRIICDGQYYAPAPVDQTILRALTLPIGVTSCGSVRDLLTDIAQVMARYAGFSENSIAAMSRWAMSTWFPELQPSPILSLVGPDSPAGRQQFQLLNCLCRHPLLLTDVNAASLRALPMEWRLTLLIHEAELSAEVQRMLNIARRSMGSIPRGGRLIDFHCAVATYTQLGNACGGVIPSLEIPVVPACNSVPVLDNSMRQRIANDFQARLLGYRFVNFRQVVNSLFDATELTPSVREVAQSLAACTPDDPDLQAQVPDFLRIQDQEIRSAAWLDLDTAIVETLLAFVHEGREDHVYVGEIAKSAEEILTRRGENRKREPRTVGPRLAVLGLITEPRDSKGIRLVLTENVARRVHKLASNLSAPSMRYGAKSCELCKMALSNATASRTTASLKR
jgi:hypothetical protein